jgi:hypothetical protein
MVIWPASAAVQIRDEPENLSPPSAATIRWTRVLGVVFVASGVFGLYALLSGMPGAEFNGV